MTMHVSKKVGFNHRAFLEALHVQKGEWAGFHSLHQCENDQIRGFPVSQELGSNTCTIKVRDCGPRWKTSHQYIRSN